MHYGIVFCNFGFQDEKLLKNCIFVYVRCMYPGGKLFEPLLLVSNKGILVFYQQDIP